MKQSTVIWLLLVVSVPVVFLLLSSGRNHANDLENQPDATSADTIEEKAPWIDRAKFELTSDFKYEVIFPDTTQKTYSFSSFNPRYSEDTLSIFCFRGNERRNAPSRGVVKLRPKSVKLDWEFKTHYDTNKSSYGAWGGGAGWTGQALLVHWNREQKEKLGIKEQAFLEDSLAMELVAGSLSGNIYFLNPKTGKPTRGHLSIKNPIKGTVSVDPRKNGLLYVGQGIPATKRIGAYVFDMYARKEIHHIPGIDPSAYRKWGAFDSNPLIDGQSGTVFWPGENGLIYKFMTTDDGKVSTLSKFKYTHPKLFRQGLEASMAVIENLGYFADNSGTILCMDLSTMSPLWNVDTGDDTDASVMLDVEGDSAVYIYVGNEVDKNAPLFNSSFRKLDALTGKEIWKVEKQCYGSDINGRANSGGILASPALGKKKGKHLVFTIFSRVDKMSRGELVAVDKHTGKTAWTFLLDAYSWASPVDFYDEEGHMYLFLTDVTGNIYLMDGISGKLIFKQKTNYIFEASPIIFDDRIVVASRGRIIASFKILGE
jgi:outer membrane protein assembly factor BamB